MPPLPHRHHPRRRFPEPNEAVRAASRGRRGHASLTLVAHRGEPTRRLGREPATDELEPLTRAYWEAGKRVSAADYLRSVEVLQRYARRVAEFFASYDLFLTPTVSAPPLPLGEMVSTDDEPLRALEVGGRTVAYSGVVANLTGNPAMSVPLHWNDQVLPIGMHFLGRFGDEAVLFRLAGQLEEARPWAHRRPLTFAS